MDNNDKKIREYQKKRLIKWTIVVLSIAVIILEILALFKVISLLWGLIVFIIIYILKKIL